MNTFLLALFCTLSCFNAQIRASDKTIPIINFICEDRSGKSVDRKILTDALRDLDCDVVCYEGTEFEIRKAHINIFCENLHKNYFDSATQNWLIPNPEWYRHPISYLDHVNLVLCRTAESERIFKELEQPTFFLNFTSVDPYNKGVEKDFRLCLHLAGTSWQKGTNPLLDAWSRHLEFPHLTITRFPEEMRAVPSNVTWCNDPLASSEVRKLQNRCGIHLYLSENEGFGHGIVEAMASGAVVITTDAPPMNEMIIDKRCLVPYGAWRRQMLGHCYYVFSEEIEKVMQNVLSLSYEELKEIGKSNRRRYKEMKEEFKKNIKLLLKQYASSKKLKLPADESQVPTKHQ